MTEYATNIAKCKNCGRQAQEHVCKDEANGFVCACPVGETRFEFASVQDRITNFNFAEGVANGLIFIEEVPEEFRAEVQVLLKRLVTHGVKSFTMRNFVWRNGEMIEDDPTQRKVQ